MLLSTFQVLNALDSGPGSLRAAIQSANANAGADLISFNISGGGVQSIQPLSQLPAITDPVAIDGTTQPGFSGSPLIEIDGTLAGTATGLIINADHSLIRGVVINRFAHSGIVLNASNNHVQGNFIGIDVTGTIALGNGARGVGILAGSQGNIIGTDGDGINDAGERNIISGNLGTGVAIDGAGADSNIVAGNFIGTDVAGTAAIPNVVGGVSIISGGQSNRIGTDGNGISDLEERNLISGNQGNGVRIGLGSADAGTKLNIVAGNYIGTDVSGMAALPNSAYGVRISGAANSNRIGTDINGVGDTFEGNLLSGNQSGGVDFQFADFTGPSGNLVAGNRIGTDATGSGSLGNAGSGISMQDSTSGPGPSGGILDNTIGGVGSLGNVVAFNGDDGILIQNAESVRNRIQGNSIHSNQGLGIDLGNNGVTSNDAADADVGANGFQNFPVLTGATSGAIGHVAGTLNSQPMTTFTLDFYANAVADPSGFGEGARYLGSANVTTNASGNVAFGVGLAGAISNGEVISATATDPSGNTSEFSAAVVAGVGATFVVTNTNNSGPGSLRQAILNANAQPRRDTIQFNISPGGPQTISLTSALTISSSLIIDGTSQPGYAGIPLIELNGAGAGSGINGLTIPITAGGSTIKGLVINRFSARGILLQANRNVVQNNYVGTDSSGTLIASNISRQLEITSAFNTIGGSAPGLGNVLSGTPGFAGLFISGPNAHHNFVAGNFIGTDFSGTAAIPNDTGIILGAGAHHNLIGTNGDGVGDPDERNIISGNVGIGVSIRDAGTDFNVVAGNHVGADVNGTEALPNRGSAGVVISGGASNNVIGTDGNGIGDSTEGNLISGNGNPANPASGSGISLQGTASGPNTVDNLVAGNLIGTDKTGAVALPNLGYGIRLLSGAAGNRIGGNGTLANRIAFNGLAGIGALTSAGSSNSFQSNSIFSNGGLGIDLNGDGVTANDIADPDEGPNRLQNYPSIDSAVTSAGFTGITGTLNSTPNQTFTVEYFLNSSLDINGNGEGETFLGANLVTTDANGNGNFLFAAGLVPTSWFITATATDDSGNTSEFSAAARVTTPPSLMINQSAVAVDEGLVAGISGTYADVDLADDVILTASIGSITKSGTNAGIWSWSFITTDGPTESQTVTITADDGFGGITTTTFLLTVNNVAPHVSHLTSTSVSEDGIAHLTGTYQDSGIQDTHSLTIDWDDGSFETISVSGGSFNVSHRYLDDNPTNTASDIYTIQITLLDNDLGAATSSTTTVVTNVAPVVEPITSATSVSVGAPATLSVLFSDIGTIDSHTCAINWGDGISSPGIVSESGGAGSCTATHTYTGSGPFNVTFTVVDDDNGIGISSLVLDVARSAFILNPFLCGALTASGNAQTQFQGPITVASSCTSSAILASGNSQVSASAVSLVGGWRTTGAAMISPSPTPIAAPVVDPLAHVAPPSGGAPQMGVTCSGNSVQTIDPGIYNRIEVSGNCQLTMNAGDYIVAGGGFKVTGNGHVTGSEVTIYNGGSNFPSPGGTFGSVQVSGNGTVDFTPPTTGSRNGIVFFQARENSRPISVSGNASGIRGTIYAPAAQLTISGNGVLQASLIVDSLRLSGNAVANLTVDSGSSQTYEPSILVAGQLLTGIVWVSIPNGLESITVDQLDRFRDSINTVNETLGPFGVNLIEVDADSSMLADIRIQFSAESSCGNGADGVLGCTVNGSDITFIDQLAAATLMFDTVACYAALRDEDLGVCRLKSPKIS